MEVDALLWIEGIQTPELQQDGDKLIMERFEKYKISQYISPRKQIKLGYICRVRDARHIKLCVNQC